MSCEHIFTIFNKQGREHKETLILRRISICGIAGFALHYEGPGDFRVSHIETGARISGEQNPTEGLAIDNATFQLASFARKHRMSESDALEMMIRQIQAFKAEAANKQ